MDVKSKAPTDILQYTGNIGVYQVFLFLVLSALSFVNLDSTLMIFFGGFMDHWCLIDPLQNYSFSQQLYIAIPQDEDTDTGYDECHHFPINFHNYTDGHFQSWDRDVMTEDIDSRDYVYCSNWVYDRSLYRSTIKSKWDLVCDDSWKTEMVTTMTMAGKLVGSIACGIISDWFGRLPGILIFVGVYFTGNLISLYPAGYITYCLGRCLVGAGTSGGNLCSFVLITEVMGSRYRAALGVLWNIVFSLAYMCMPIAAYYLRSEDSLVAVYTWTVIPSFLFAIILQESPRWLLSKGKDKEAEEIIHFIADVNHREVPDELDLSAIKSNAQKDKAKNTGTLRDLLKYPNMRKETLIVWFNWFTNSLVYYGLSLNTGRIAVNIYVNTFIMGAIEIPANLLAIYLMDKIGRKWTIGWSCVFGGIASLLCVVLILVDASTEVLTAFSVLGKAGITMAFSGAYVYAVEIFPTPVRNVGIGSSSMTARISGMAAPFVGGPLA